MKIPLLKFILFNFPATLFTSVCSAALALPNESNAPSQYETVVEDVAFNSSSRIVLTESMIRKSRARDIPSLLSQVANISVTNTAFQPTSLSLRGGDSGHVLILLDGVPFYDASTIQRTGNLASLDVHSIKQIEIVKGSQSVLYGGQALGGLIKIQTLPNRKSQSASFEAGTQNHVKVQTEWNQKNILARGSHTEKKLESPVKGSSRTYDASQENLDIAYRWDHSTQGFIKASVIQNSQFSPSSDANNQVIDVKKFKLFSLQNFLTSQVQIENAAWEPRFSWGLQTGKRNFDFPDVTTPTDEEYTSNLRFFRLDFRPFKSETIQVDLGLSYLFEDFLFKDMNIKLSDAFLEQRGFYLKMTSLIADQTTVSYGARIENWSQQGPVTVYHVGLQSYKTRAEISTGYKAPSLYQLRSRYGNLDLKEEQSSQASLEQEFAIDKQRNFSVTLFYSKFRNLITTTGTFPNLQYTNLKQTETRGSELSYNQEFAPGQALHLNFGYQEPRDLSTDTWLLRRPLTSASLQYHFTYGKQTGSLQLLNVGARKDFGSTSVVRLKSYSLVNLGTEYPLSHRDQLYLRIDNLTSSRYQETYGYYAEGISTLAGWTRQF